MLYERVIEVEERYTAQGKNSGQSQSAREGLQAAYDDGILLCDCVDARLSLPQPRAADSYHSQEHWFYPSFSISSQPLMKLVSRGDTTVVDAYLSPILRRYVNQVSSQMGGVAKQGEFHPPHAIDVHAI